MRVRTFTAATMPDAMAQVRAEMGEDAVILSSQRSRRGVELRAAVERPPALGLEDVDAAYSRLAALESEMERRLIAALSEPQAPAAPAQVWTLDRIADRLSFHETPSRLASRLLETANRFEAGGLDALAQALDAHLAFSPLPAEPDRPIALIGAPGAGKTASAAKLAVRAVLAGRPAALISADTSAGAASQIEAFADLIRMPVSRVDTPAALTAELVRLAQSAEPPVVFIDTPGVNPFDRGEMQQLRNLLAAAPGVEPVLVSHAHGGGDLEEHALLFLAAGARRMIATRLDLTRRLGGLLSAVAGSGLALAQGASSPYIAETLEPLNPFALARRLLTGAAEPGAAP